MAVVAGDTVVAATTKGEGQEDMVAATVEEEEDIMEEDMAALTVEEAPHTVCELAHNISKSLTRNQDIKIRLFLPISFPSVVVFVLVLCNAFSSFTCLNQGCTNKC